MRDRLIALLYILFLYGSLPIMPGLWERFQAFAGDFANYVAYVILLALGLCITEYLIVKQKGFQSFIWLVVLVSLYILGLNKIELAIERMHFIEYGLLSILMFRALRHNLKDKSIYLWSGIIVFCLGFLDEGIQYILPNRVYDSRDVIVNGLAGVLGLLLIRFVLRPKIQK